MCDLKLVVNNDKIDNDKSKVFKLGASQPLGSSPRIKFKIDYKFPYRAVT